MAFARIHPRLSRLTAFILMAVLSIALTACPRPLMPPMGAPGTSPYTTNEPDQVSGYVDFGTRTVQANLDADIMPGSTIALIEVDTGNTVSTARTDENGKFVLKYSNGFKPVPGKLYYFEALKGLADVTGKPNAVGSDLVRVRTIASYRQGGWVSLTSSRLGFYMPITAMTTALSIVVSLRSTTTKPIDASTLFGSVWLGQTTGAYPDRLVFPDTTLLPVTLVQQTYDLVIDAFLKNRDPMRWVTFGDAAFDKVMLPDVPFTIERYDPPEQVAQAELAIVGTNFSPKLSDHEVVFRAVNGTTAVAQLVSISPDLSHLTVKVPAEAVSGPLVLSIGTGENRKTLTGQTFRLATRDGHSVVDALGNTYVVNSSMGTVAKVGPLPGVGKNGVRSVITGLDKPGALTFAPGNYRYLYVALGGSARRVVKYDLEAADPSASGVAYSTGVGVANPSGIAFRTETGALYLTDVTADKLYVITAAGAAVQEVTLNAALSGPRGLSFGPDRRLYVANSKSGDVVAITLSSATTGTVAPYQSGLSTPWGVAFDNLNAFYVSNNKGNSIFKQPVVSLPGVTPLVYGPLTSFASIPNPGGIDADASGYLYVADNVSNGIYTVNPDAEARQIGYGISYPVATWADADGLFTLTDEGRMLHLDAQQNLSVYAEGLTGTRGLMRDKLKNFYTVNTTLKALIIVRPDGSSMPVTPMNALNGYYPELSINNAGDRFYLRKASSDHPSMGQVDAFDLNLNASGLPVLTGVPVQVFKSPLRRFIAIAADRTAADRPDLNAYRGQYYVLQNNENNEQAIFRVTMVNSQTYDTVRLVAGGRLKEPVDIAVAEDGKIWVADRQGFDGDGGLIIYNPDGTFHDEIQTITDPQRLAYDPIAKRIAASCYAANEIHFYNAAKTRVQLLRGIALPVGAAFSDTAPHTKALFVNSHSTGQVYRFLNYTALGNKTFTAGELSAAEYYYTGANNDIELLGNELLYTHGSAIGNVKTDRITVKENWQNHYSGMLRLNRNHDEGLISVTDYSWAHLPHNGSHQASFSGLRAGSNSGKGAPIVLNGSMVSYSHIGYREYAIIVDSDFDGKNQRSYRPDWYLGAATSNGTDTAFFAHTYGGSILQWKVDPVTKKGAPSTVVSGGYSGFDFTHGLAYYDGYLYQPIREKHVVRKVNVAAKTAAELKVGVVAPEL